MEESPEGQVAPCPQARWDRKVMQGRRADATCRSDAREDPARGPCPQPHSGAGATRRLSEGSREAVAFSSFCPFAHSATKRPRGRFIVCECAFSEHPPAKILPCPTGRPSTDVRGQRLSPPRAPHRHSVMLSNKFWRSRFLDTIVLFGLFRFVLVGQTPSARAVSCRRSYPPPAFHRGKAFTNAKPIKKAGGVTPPASK